MWCRCFCRVFWFFALIFLAIWCYGAPSIDQEAVDAFQSKLSQLRTFSASFREVVFNEDHVVSQQYQGHLFLKRPSELLWTIEKPLKQFLLVRKTTFWMYEPDLEQAWIRTLHDSDIGKTPLLLLTHEDIYWSKYFRIVHSSQNQFTLYPKEKSELFEKLIFTFDGDTLNAIEWKSSVGQSAVVHFSDIEENEALDSSVFDLKIPKNTEIIREP